MGKNSINWLFDTKALVVSPAKKPFIYTSGLIGPYYINTHYLCGGKEVATDFLNFIDEKAESADFVDQLFARLEAIYESDEIFKALTDTVTENIKTNFDVDSITHVSGGQRRDWFFAPLVARKLSKPFLSLYNDLRIKDESGNLVEDLSGASVLNIADLLTIGSSYTKKWIPAVKVKGGNLIYSFNVADRLQGGEGFLKEAGVEKLGSIFAINAEFLSLAKEKGYLDEAQFKLVMAYLKDPHVSMKSLLEDNPDFIKSILNSGSKKEKARAQLLIDENHYA